ncbi:MAG: glycosyltransferase family 4 protein [Planctomycetaceae bacterium]|jgi:glycosyltransferase involved in cell wall biosynthesis|nr:glycosyltransferase family 4 protein [Planctomycetaceae bacterium]
MKVLHLTASPFFGGPERVILDIVQSQREYNFDVESEIATFRENGNSEQFLSEIRNRNLIGYVINRDMPNLLGSLFDLLNLLRLRQIDLICAHGHKSRFLGWVAARRMGIPIVGISHGWTWQDWKTSAYERIDQWIHHRLDKVVCVSQGQADKVIKSGTNPNRVVVIHNAIDIKRFDAEYELTRNSKKSLNKSGNKYFDQLIGFFKTPPKILIGAAGRLSPEKGYDVLIDAIKILVDAEKSNNADKNYCNENYRNEDNVELSFGVILFGEGFIRPILQKRIDEAGVSDRFKMVGFTSELDKFLPYFDVFVQSSRTEGFPCVNLEAMASGVPVVATSVGGVPEQIESGYSGILVPSENPSALADGIRDLIIDENKRHNFGETARQFVKTNFIREKLAKAYFELFEQLKKG